MVYDYGYGELEDKLINLLRSGAPDFDAAEELIRQGADINAVGKDEEENILSEILCGYHLSARGEACDYCDGDHCADCEYNRNYNPDLGPAMCAIIRFFLDHGFDLDKRDGCVGAQCLNALRWSTFDRYMIQATKLLLDADARNRPASPSSTDEDDTPWSLIATERSWQDLSARDYATGNILEAVCQVYQAVADGRPYGGIDSYEVAIGKRIIKVLAETDGAGPTFYSMDLPSFKRDNCYTQTLYFVYDGGALKTNQYADVWTDAILPAVDMVDVSAYFDGIVGSIIKRFEYGHRSVVKGTMCYDQPIVTIEMDSGRRVRFSTNFGEVKKEERAAFCELLE